MENKIQYTVEKIDSLEKSLLNSNSNYSLLILENYIGAIKELRRDLYYLCLYSDKKSEQTIAVLKEEYVKFCKFNYDLVKTKLLSNVGFATVISSMLGSYKWIKPYDTDGSMQKTTEDIMNKLIQDLYNSDCKMKYYRIRGLKHMLGRFKLDVKQNDSYKSIF